MALVDIVYTGATHNRFSHSIGAAYLANKAILAIINNIETGDGDQLKEYRGPLVLAALLHDIGHGPFSHLFESLFLETDLDLGCKRIGMPSHEEWGNKIYEKLIEEVKKEENSEATVKMLEVAKKIYCVKKENGEVFLSLHSLVSSQLDVDWIISNLLIHKKCGKYNSKVAIKNKAVTAVEDYLFFRKIMYDRVAFHPKIRAYEYLMKCFLNRYYKHVGGRAKEPIESNETNPITDYFIKLQGIFEEYEK